MSKVIKAIAIIVVAVAIIVFAPQIGGWLASTFVGAAFATTGAIISTVVAIGLSLGLSAVGSLFRKKPTLSSANADRLNTEVVPTAPRKIVFGTTAAGNDVRFFELYGSKQDRQAQVIALSSHPLTTIHSWYVENDLVWSPGGGIASNKYGVVGWRGYGYTTDGPPAGHPCGTQTLWTNTANFAGCSYIIVDYQLSSSAIPSKTTTVIDGCPLYDPRLDSSRAGSGAHRLEDQTTWQFTSPATNRQIGRNPALALLAYLIGWRYNGKLMWGMGISPANINLDNFKDYANLCEESVLLAGGGTVQRYTCDGIFSTSDTHETIINAITAAMGSCKLSDVGGQYCLIGGYDDTLGPIQSFSDDDIVGGASAPSPFHWSPAGGSSEYTNIASGRFADPAQQYQLNTWGEIDTDPLPDGIPRTLTLDFGCVSRAETCQRIAKQFLLRGAICPGTFSATFGPLAFCVQVGSLVRLTVQSMGWNGKLFRVQEQREVEDMIYPMVLREESPDIYAWDKEEKPLPAVIIPQGYDPTMTLTPQNVTLEAVTYQGVA